MTNYALRFFIAVLLAALTGLADAQREDRAPFLPRDGYEEARFGGEDVTIKTRDGSKMLHVSVAKIRIAQTAKPAVIHLPGAGLALFQHAAGRAKVVAAREQFEPLEGEWLRLPLPAELSIGTDEDTLVLDLILVEERAR